MADSREIREEIERSFEEKLDRGTDLQKRAVKSMSRYLREKPIKDLEKRTGAKHIKTKIMTDRTYRSTRSRVKKAHDKGWKFAWTLSGNLLIKNPKGEKTAHILCNGLDLIYPEYLDYAGVPKR